MWQTLKEKIRDILEANSLIQEVHTYEIDRLKGYPAATIIPSGHDNEYSTTADNQRVYNFIISLYIQQSGQYGEKEIDDAMAELVDSVIDDFDKDFTLAGISVPTGYTMIRVEAVPSTWGYVERESFERVANIEISCVVDVDITEIN